MDADGTNRQQLGHWWLQSDVVPPTVHVSLIKSGRRIEPVTRFGWSTRMGPTGVDWPPAVVGSMNLQCGHPTVHVLHTGVVSGGVYVVDSDGGNVELLNDSGNGPAWSPDGSRIVFGVSRPAAEAGIYIMDSDGSNPELLTASSSDAPPEWSPDGSRILFLSGDAAEFFVMDPDGGTPRSVASLGARGGHVLSPGVSEQQSTDGVDDPLKMIDAISQEAVWSPDGSRIAYNDGRSLYVLNSDGSNSQRVVVARCGVIPSPVWSPDGTRISYEGQRLHCDSRC